MLGRYNLVFALPAGVAIALAAAYLKSIISESQINDIVSEGVIVVASETTP